MKAVRDTRVFGSLGFRCVCAVAVALALTAIAPTLRAARSIAVLSELMGARPPFAWIADLRATVREEDRLIALPSGPVRTRLFIPVGVQDPPGMLVLHGVHPRGIDEPRLRAFAHSLAAVGVSVMTPELSELIAYRIDASTVTKIQQLSAAEAQLTSRKSAGVIGISFAGGLALMAAAQQNGTTPIGFVVSVGSHHDLARLCDYYAGKPVFGPNGERTDVAPHPYGARVMIREHLDRFFSATDLPLARRALDSYLRDRHDLARKQAQALSTVGQPIMATLLDEATSPALAQLLESAAAAASDQLAAASPKGHLAGLQVPVFLVHGQADPIIPSIETRWLAREVPPRTLRRLVITPLLRHAEFPTPPTFGETWELVRLMGDILQAAGSAPDSKVAASATAAAFSR
jgi:pimeloyl-ACP methyl ester carboxylesterase